MLARLCLLINQGAEMLTLLSSGWPGFEQEAVEAEEAAKRRRRGDSSSASDEEEGMDPAMAEMMGFSGFGGTSKA